MIDSRQQSGGGHKCPKCGAICGPSGELVDDEGGAVVYQCDQCVVNVSIFEGTFPAAYTFAVRHDGTVIDDFAE